MSSGGMDLPADARWISLPCMLATCGMQYMHFAKKPMTAPCHRLSERLARRCVLLGLATELVCLRLLPICEAYPMNASCLVFLFFWRESKRSAAVQKSEIFACVCALSAWALPFANAVDGRVSEPKAVDLLVDLLMAPRTCAYVVGMLACSVVVHCIGHGSCLLGSCAPAGMNFAVSAMLLKALTQATALLVASPLRPELWAALALIAALLLGVRSAASKPLRKALEVHDTLSILAFYGAISSAAAAITGEVIYGEMDAWDQPHKLLYLVVAALHCWGMFSLGGRGSDVRGHKDGDKDSSTDDGPAIGRKATEFGKSLQLAELSGRGAGGLAAGGSSAKSAVHAAADGRDRPPTPLLNFTERTVDEDAQMEEKLFAHALAPLKLEPSLGVLPGTDGSADAAWSAGWPEMAGASEAGAAGGFDADFEELMRRFGQDEAADQLITDLPAEAKPQAAALPAVPPGVLAYDAQTLLDDTGVQDDEDELLNSIEDIPGP